MAFDYFIFFQALEDAMSFSLNLFSSSASLLDCEKQHLPLFEVVLGVRVGVIPFIEIGHINPLGSSALN